MVEGEVFIAADRALERVIKHIQPKQYEQIVPPAMTARQPGSSLRQIINYHTYDELWVPEVLAGKTAEQVGDRYDGDQLGDDPAKSYSRALAKAVDAVRQLADPRRLVHLSYGDYPAHEYLRHISIFRGFRAYDIAKFIGVDPALPEDLVQGLWSEISTDAEELRQLGVFGPRVEVPENADLQSRLLGLAGRDPRA